jgi:hypothetical protein
LLSRLASWWSSHQRIQTKQNTFLVTFRGRDHSPLRHFLFSAPFRGLRSEQGQRPEHIYAYTIKSICGRSFWIEN